MAIQSVQMRRLDGQTGVVRPASTGILAIIAAATGGPINQPSTYFSEASVVSQFTGGPLVEDASYVLNNAGKPVVLVACNASNVGTYGTVTQLALGGSSLATAGATTPLDEYDVLITFVTGGTRGTAGITYTASLDGGRTSNGVQALGTATSIAVTAALVANSGVTINLSAGTIIAGSAIQVTTSRPQPNASDITAACSALRTSRQAWDSLYIDVDATTSEFSALDSWLAALETGGIYNEGYLNVRHKLMPVSLLPYEQAFAASMIAASTILSASMPYAESELTYGNAFSGWSAVSSVRIAVGADAGFVESNITGLTQPRQTILFDATRSMASPIGVAPSFVGAGAVPNCTIDDVNGNPCWHDEYFFPTLDSQRFVTLRSYPGQLGTFITSSNLFSPAGSDYVFTQQGRVMNAAMTVAFAMLTTELGKGVQKTQPNAQGQQFILESSAAAIEAFVNAALAERLKGQVNGVQLTLSRTDNIASNAGAVITFTLVVSPLATIVEFSGTTSFGATSTAPLPS